MRKLGWLSLGLVFLLDRLFKTLACFSLAPWLVQSATVNGKMVSGLFGGGALSLFLASLIILVLIHLWLRFPQERLWLAWLILGAASNLWDRFMFGGVIDYWGGWYWPWVFNLADLMIIGSLLWYLSQHWLARK